MANQACQNKFLRKWINIVKLECGKYIFTLKREHACMNVGDIPTDSEITWEPAGSLYFLLVTFHSSTLVFWLPVEAS